MFHLTVFEAVLMGINAIGLAVNASMLRDVLIDKCRAGSAGKARRLVASNAVRREALRVGGQVLLLAVLWRGVFWDDRPGDMPRDLVGLLSLLLLYFTVFCTINGLLDRHNRRLIVTDPRGGVE